MAYETKNVEDFLNHSTQDRGGKFLSKWKKNEPPVVDTWNHTQRRPVILWRHGLPKVVVKEGKSGGDVTMVWGGQYNCHEDEGVLKTQYRRNDDKSRKNPPTTCGLCRLNEAVYYMIQNGKLDWLEPLFSFEADDPKQNAVLHAGGLGNLFGRDDLSAEALSAMAEKGIYQRDSWKQNAMAKASYVFSVVDNADVGAGVQIAIETGLLGDKVKDVINAARTSLGKEDGDPFHNPYAIRWQHCPSEQVFNNKYRAIRMEKIPLTEEIAKLIRGDAPDLTGVIAPFNQEEMRAYLEQHCVSSVKLPWDEIFKFQPKLHVVPAQQPAMQPRPAPVAAKAPPVASVDDEMVECDDDACKAVMRMTDPKCPKCGKVYIEEKVAPPPPPPPAMKKRGQIAEAAATAPAAVSAPTAATILGGDTLPF